MALLGFEVRRAHGTPGNHEPDKVLVGMARPGEGVDTGLHATNPRFFKQLRS